LSILFNSLFDLQSGIGHKRHKPCELNCIRNQSLVFIADMISLGGSQLKLGGNKSSQKCCILIVNFGYIVLT
jgi:hypothetical protein